MMRFSTCCLLVLVTVLSQSSAAAAEWPQWRGPLASGEAPAGNPPLTWSESENVAWKAELPGRGLSTPVVWGDLVFLTTAIPGEPVAPAAAEGAAEPGGGSSARRRPRGVAPDRVVRFEVLALDRATGAVRWRHAAREAQPHEGTHTDGSWAAASPVTDGEVVIASFGSHGLYAYDLAGKLLWSKDLGDMTTRNGFGEGASPALYGDTVVVNWDHEGPSFIVALDKRTGKEHWRAERDEVTSWSTPVVIEVAGKPQVVVSATGRVRGYDLATGKVVWEAGGMTVNTVPSPVYGDGLVYVASGFRGNALLAIRLAAARGDVTGGEAIAWSLDRDTPYVPSPLLYDGELYFLKSNSGILTCADAVSGAIHYQQRLEGVDGVYASPVAAAGRVYLAGRNGTTLVLAAGESFEPLAVNALDDTFDASPAIAGSQLFLRGHRHLYALEAENAEAVPAGGRAAPVGAESER